MPLGGTKYRVTRLTHRKSTIECDNGKLYLYDKKTHNLYKRDLSNDSEWSLIYKDISFDAAVGMIQIQENGNQEALKALYYSWLLRDS